jgi:tetratricopeptide (TPR) repeat protein
VQLAQGDGPAALQSYRDAFAIAERMARSNPGNAGWQRDLCVSYDKVGDAQSAQGDLQDALQSYRSGLAVAVLLTSLDRSNTQWQEDRQFIAGRIGGLAYKFLIARDFETALQAADQAIAVLPDELWIKTNRAHALMFLGQADAARALYLKYRGQKVNQDGQAWEAAVLDDFSELRKAGLASPLMDEIEKLFTSAG